MKLQDLHRNRQELVVRSTGMKDTEEQMEETVGIEEEERKQETRRIAEEQQSIED